jgi:hypothetical protein
LDPKRCPVEAELLDRVNRAIDAAAGIKGIRDEAIAHRSNEFNYSSAFKRAGVKPDSIPDLLSEFLDLANELRKKQNLQVADFAPLPRTDAMRLIHALGGPDLRPRNTLDDIL